MEELVLFRKRKSLGIIELMGGFVRTDIEIKSDKKVNDTPDIHQYRKGRAEGSPSIQLDSEKDGTLCGEERDTL